MVNRHWCKVNPGTKWKKLKMRSIKTVKKNVTTNVSIL